MNKEKTKQIFEAYGNPGFETESATISFARQNKSDVEEIESMSDEKILNQWKSLVYMNYVLGHISVNELQRIDLLDLEISGRESIKEKDLDDWLNEELKILQKQEEERYE